ncbi:DNA glycosylase [Epithele typhae]|uniref:DNA glycosylase n=1 Tax=Epithele typhae TaxID=378194 RepID=UPI002007FB46|nr:DNA glycosylase [Epithele typhae]KAH9941170.1 DNA glycosylase [Epithele typhae]
MARKRKAAVVDSDSDFDASYEPRGTRDDASSGGEDEDDWRPSRSTKGAARTLKKKGKGGKSGDASNAQRFACTHPASLHVLDRPVALREALLDWYEGVHAMRGMPWRKPFNPQWDGEQKAQRAYEVWVSEIMLQQTQVVTVIPYYNRWMEKYAASDIDSVNSLWKGLGYYSRAARLLAGAQKAVRDFGGRLPDNAQDLEAKIPGIGRYSSGAIASIAYNECAPVLDGNVHRLLSRVLALHASPKAKATLDLLWAAAAAFVAAAPRPGAVNEALIELGATVCKVQAPSCGVCPLQAHCGAHARHGASEAPAPPVPDIEELCAVCEPLPSGAGVTAYPMKAEKKRAREELDVVSVVEWRAPPGGGEDPERWFLLVRRPEGGLLAGLHEFPTAPNVPQSTSPQAQAASAHALLSSLLVSPPPSPSGTGGSAERSPKGVRVTQIAQAGDVLHVFSHIRKTYRAQWVLLEGGAGEAPPALAANPVLAFAGDGDGEAGAKPRAAARKTKKAKAHDKNDDAAAVVAAAADASPTPPQTQWVRMDAVERANIGTGVVKVWRQVRALWEREGEDHDARMYRRLRIYTVVSSLLSAH